VNLLQKILLRNLSDWQAFGKSIGDSTVTWGNGARWSDTTPPGTGFDAPKAYPCMLVYTVTPLPPSDGRRMNGITQTIRHLFVTRGDLHLWKSQTTVRLGKVMAEAKRVAEGLLIDAGPAEFVLRRNAEKLKEANSTILSLLEHLETVDGLLAAFWNHAQDALKAWELGTDNGKRPLQAIRLSAHLIEDIRESDAFTKMYVRGQMPCDECGKPFRIDEHGIATHMLTEEDIDHGTDACHVPFSRGEKD
jgi:hypothetical protein